MPEPKRTYEYVVTLQDLGLVNVPEPDPVTDADPKHKPGAHIQKEECSPDLLKRIMASIKRI